MTEPAPRQAPTRPAAKLRADAPRFDFLTGLLTRHAFIEALSHAMASGQSRLSLVVVDLELFRDINDAFGFGVGDGVLRNAARRLHSMMEPGDLAGRLGGNQFAIAVAGERASTVENIAQTLIDSLEHPYALASQRVLSGASGGVAKWDGACPADALIARAERALRRARSETSRSFRVYTPAIDTPTAPRRELEAELRRAIETNNLQLAYQPIFNAKKLDLRSAEALVRWRHPEKGDIPPKDFIPVAEESGAIVDLGWWVLETALKALKRWDQATIAVNVSPLQFRHHGFALRVHDYLHEMSVSPDRLEIEVTESVFMTHADMAERTLRQLRKSGIRVALDDFGAGFSSLGYLRQFKFDKIKIDQSFLRGSADAENVALLRAIIDLCHGVGAKVVVEGVESREQVGLLQLLGSDYLQGYFLGVPMAPEAFQSKFFGGESAASADKLALSSRFVKRG